jgi:hypothetical protein
MTTVTDSGKGPLEVWLHAANDSVHVLGAGATPVAAVVMMLIRSGARSVLDPVALASVVHTWTVVLVIPFVALVALMATGFVRLGYRTAICVPEAIAAKGKAAVAKHVVFGALYVVSVAALIVLIQP